MYMRMVRARVKSGKTANLQSLYDSTIIPALRETPGCLYALLMQSGTHPDELVSMTIWESPDDADAYVKSGTFERLMGQARPFLSETSEWRVALSKDMKLESAPVPQEPVISAFPVSINLPMKQMTATHPKPLYLRILTVRLKPDARDEFHRIYINSILPVLQEAPGCRYAYLVMPGKGNSEAISITMWDSRDFADSYEKGGQFGALLKEVKHTFTDLFQWKLGLGSAGQAGSATSDDVTAEGYSVVTMGSFQ